MRDAIKTVRTPVLEVAYEEHGPGDGPPVLLLHGWPYDVRAYDGVAVALAGAGCRVVVPWLRGFGMTRFLDPATPRCGQQGALGADVRDLVDALGMSPAVLVGYDWGGRGACAAAALWPARVRGLVTIGGYTVQDIAGAVQPGPAEQEWRWWYQYYFQTPRGAAGLEANRREICRLLWRLWSPAWAFDEATFEASAAAFDNPDWVAVTLQSYRHRFGYAPGDPALEEVEAALASRPAIGVPTVVLHGGNDGVAPPEGAADLSRFNSQIVGSVRREVVPGVGHNMPQERAEPVVRAVLELLA